MLGEVWIRGIKLFCWLQVVFSQSTSMVFLHGTLYTTMWQVVREVSVREIFHVEGLDQLVKRVTSLSKDVAIKQPEIFIQS